MHKKPYKNIVFYDRIVKIRQNIRGVIKMNKQTKKPRNEEMYEAILTLKTVEECINFFEDLCTITELQAMEQRFQVASLLNKGCIYNEILEQTGASSATISRVNRSLQYGQDGYSLVFKRLAEQKETEQE